MGMSVKISIDLCKNIFLQAVNCKSKDLCNVLKVSFCLCHQCTCKGCIWVPLLVLLIPFSLLCSVLFPYLSPPFLLHCPWCFLFLCDPQSFIWVQPPCIHIQLTLFAWLVGLDIELLLEGMHCEIYSTLVDVQDKVTKDMFVYQRLNYSMHHVESSLLVL